LWSYPSLYVTRVVAEGGGATREDEGGQKLEVASGYLAAPGSEGGQKLEIASGYLAAPGSEGGQKLEVASGYLAAPGSLLRGSWGLLRGYCFFPLATSNFIP
jgi:hypothetical protein